MSGVSHADRQAAPTGPQAGEDSGGDAAWEALYRNHYASAVRLAGLLLGDYPAGEEIAQEAFARLWESRLRVEEPGAYLRGIVVNLCRSRIRRAAVRRRHPAPLPAPEPGPEDATGRIAARMVLRGALADLPHREREAIVLRFYGQLTQTEIASVMGISIGAVKTHLHRAMATLRTKVEGLR